MPLVFLAGPMGSITGERGSSPVRIWGLSETHATVSTKDEKVHTVALSEVDELVILNPRIEFIPGETTLDFVAERARRNDRTRKQMTTIGNTPHLANLLNPSGARVKAPEPMPAPKPVEPEPPGEPFVVVDPEPEPEPEPEPAPEPKPRPAAEPVKEEKGGLPAWALYVMIGMAAVIVIGFVSRR